MFTKEFCLKIIFEELLIHGSVFTGHETIIIRRESIDYVEKLFKM